LQSEHLAMSSVGASAEQALPAPLSQARSASYFALAALAVAVGACLLAGWAPLRFSIVTVFLFAGPHNWLEARYFLARMPARWGALQKYFCIGIGGVLVLTGAFAALPWLAQVMDFDENAWRTATACWNTALLLWIVLLTQLRSRQNPRRNWSWIPSLGFVIIGLIWLIPGSWDIALVYMHPLVALWFLDRELARSRPQWRQACWLCLGVVAGLLGLLWWQLASAPPLPGEDGLTLRITRHAGAEVLAGVSSHLLVATHTFLEMLHYGVWLVAIPLVSFKSAPWKLQGVPLARTRWRGAVAGLLLCGGLAVLVLWGGFLADYPLTRDIYFTVAMVHVLAEVPFLLRSL
jgi:hypothetical protein